MSDDWFRNIDWNEGIETAFFTKLRRARDKAQYLRIQASTLVAKHSEVALRLLDQYFGLGDHFDQAQAYVDRAKAHLALDDLEQALQSYEAALRREATYPNLKTEAYLEFPFLVATNRLRSRYGQSLKILEDNALRPMFPVDHFMFHSAFALICADIDKARDAQEHARAAVEAAAKDHSGFRYHPCVGLVGDKYDHVQEHLGKLASAYPRQRF